MWPIEANGPLGKSAAQTKFLQKTSDSRRHRHRHRHRHRYRHSRRHRGKWVGVMESAKK